MPLQKSNVEINLEDISKCLELMDAIDNINNFVNIIFSDVYLYSELNEIFSVILINFPEIFGEICIELSAKKGN
jgi:hypothetical protein